MAAVDVDWKRLGRARRDSYNVWLRLHWDPPLDAATVTAALTAVELPAPVVNIPVVLTGPLPLPDGGALVNITEMVSLAKLREFIAALQQTLATAEGTLRIEPLQRQYPKLPDYYAHIAISASLPWRPDARERFIHRRDQSEHRAAYWLPSDLEPDALATAVRIALDWCDATGPEGTTHVYDNFSPYPMDAALARTVTQAALTRGHYNVGYFHVHPQHGIRGFALDLAGRLLFHTGRPPQPLRLDEAGATVSGLLTELAPVLTSAVVFTSKLWSTTSDRLVGAIASPTMPANAGSLWMSALLSDRRLIDAFGLVYLGPGFTGLAQDPQHYRTIPLGEGRILVHHDVDAWLRTNRPDEELRTQARNDLSDLVLTRDDVQAEYRSFGYFTLSDVINREPRQAAQEG